MKILTQKQDPNLVGWVAVKRKLKPLNFMKTLALFVIFLSSFLVSNAEEYGGIGVWIAGGGKAREPLRTDTVWTNSPADKVGIKPGMLLIAVNGTNVVDKTVMEVIAMIRGPIGKPVTLELTDEKRTKTNKFTVKRGKTVVRDNKVVEVTE